MYQIKATLRNKDRPESGSVTVQFPIPWKEYDRILEQLKPLSIGGPIAQDCQVEAIDSHYSILKRLEERPVSLDELDYLAKRLDGFDVSEALQFQGAAAAEDVITIRDFINLTFCCQRVTVVQDFRNLEQIGKDHLMALGDGSASMEEWKNTDFRKMALNLLQSGEGKVTPYGVVYKNGMELRPLYFGGPFPAYWCGEPLVVTFKPREESAEQYLFLPMAESRLRRELERSGVIDPENIELCSIDEAPMEEIVSSLSMEKEDIFSLNRLAVALEDLPPTELEKLKAAIYLTEPDSADKMASLIRKLDRLELFLRPLSEELHTLRLYMPVTAALHASGNPEEEHLDGHDLVNYEEEIATALEQYSKTVASDRGLMEYYHGMDGLKTKVRSLTFGFAEHQGRVWGVAECRVMGELSGKELDALKEYITGQAADGFGEGFEQQDIRSGSETLYVSFWSSDEWSLRTEEELFGQQQMKGGMSLGQSF